MKKSTIILGIILLFICNSFKPAAEIKWYGFNEGYELAKKKKKLMLIDVYTDWCGWCKRMDRDTYMFSEIVDLVNKDFVAIKFNPELNATYNYEGKILNGKEMVNFIGDSKITGYPATVFAHPKSNHRKLIIGYRNPDQMKGELSNAVAELNLKK